ncbi:MAG: hypothetical protein NZZ60_04240 [Bacteroidia bacterium]|nr:hypothetical protein [Bacteroidia bacterium]MCX7651484.1 hypothetical protein [Bacteroidia bacterium]MDW8416761.1 hypothetical protein [Bacteroidia bacterium]
MPVIWAQRPSPLPEVYEAIQRGLTVNAQRLLAQAREHPDSLVRQEAALLQGYFALKSGREKDALREWYALSQRKPRSPLIFEASFWRADRLLKSYLTRHSGLYLLRTLLEDPNTPPDLRAAVERRLEYFFWHENDLGSLWGYLIEGNSTLYPYFLPSLLYQMRQSCEWRLWPLWESIYTDRCDSVPDSLRWDSLVRELPPETLRVVLLLPLMANQERSSPFLEFWRGFEAGLSDVRSLYPVWRIEVEDSERDPLRIQSLLATWDSTPPHVIIGEVSWTLNQTIADFCERKEVWHLVPINPAYPQRRLTVPLTIPGECVGWQLADILSKRSLRRGAIFYTSGDPQGKAVAEGFRRRWYAPLFEIPSTLAEMAQTWTALRDSLGKLDWYGLFFSQEDLVNYALHTLRNLPDTPLVIGLESWGLFKHTNLTDYPRLRIRMPQSFVPDSAEWDSFTKKLRLQHVPRVSFFHAQGYDAAQYLVKLCNDYQRNTPPRGEHKGILNLYTLPPNCEKYRLIIWEYERRTSRISVGP